MAKLKCKHMFIFYKNKKNKHFYILQSSFVEKCEKCPFFLVITRTYVLESMILYKYKLQKLF